MRRSLLAAASVPTLLVFTGFALASESSPDLAHPFIQALAPTLMLGVPLALASVVIVRRVAEAAVGVDFPARLIAVSTAGLPEDRREWGSAMRAELDAVEGASARRRFATGCSLAAIWAGITRRAVVLAAGFAALIGLGTLIASRVSLGLERGGILSYSTLVPVAVLFTVGLMGARRSFRAGLTTGALTLVFSLVCVAIVGTVEAGLWFDSAGVYIMDGDSPKAGMTRAAVILDPISPSFVLLHLLFWLPWSVLGAALGTRRADRCVRPVESVLA